MKFELEKKAKISLLLKGLVLFIGFIIFLWLIAGAAGSYSGFFYVYSDDDGYYVDEYWVGWKGYQSDQDDPRSYSDIETFKDMRSGGSAAGALIIIAIPTSLLVEFALGVSLVCTFKQKKKFARYANIIAVACTAAVLLLDVVALVVMIGVFSSKVANDELDEYYWNPDWAFILQFINCVLWGPAVLVLLGIASAYDK
ncbi:hypothetical protein QOT17_005977 [Balamuthia mandrillaris]